MNTKKEYIAPKLTEFSYMSEEGFALSIMNYLHDPDDDFDDCGQENWDWNDGNNQFEDGWNNWENN